MGTRWASESWACWLGIGISLAIFLAFASSAAADANALREIPPKIDPALFALVSGGCEISVRASASTAANELSKLTAIAEVGAWDAELARAWEALGLKVVKAMPDFGLVKVELPLQPRSRSQSHLSLLSRLSERPELIYLRLPYQPLPARLEGRGLALVGAKDFHELGIRGKGVRIGVIDVGFSGFFRAALSGDFPERFTLWGDLAGGYHGTAVTEILFDFAPEADFYLFQIDDEVDFAEAVEWAIAHDIQVINHSVVWLNTEFGGRGDGLISRIVERARAAGILWVNSAGNFAEEHWLGQLTSSRIQLLVRVRTAGKVYAYLNWDEWPHATTDLDLVVYDGRWHVIASSRMAQDGDDPPVEALSWEAQPGFYFLEVSLQTTKRAEVSTPVELYLYSPDGIAKFAEPVPEASVPAPASARASLAVGAMAAGNWTPGYYMVEPYSSRGPTYDGRIKPDIIAPTGILTVSYGFPGFYGTSAAAPHVAGCAALWLAYQPDLTAEELERYLLEQAEDLGPEGKDDLWGAGLLRCSPIAGTGGDSSGTPARPGPGPLEPGLPSPRDLDGDGLFEDANGNGRVDFHDAILIALHLDELDPRWFDFNRNGRMDFADALELVELASKPREAGADRAADRKTEPGPSVERIQFRLEAERGWLAVRIDRADEIHLEVFSLGGRKLGQARARGGELTWPLLGPRAERLANGVYLAIITYRREGRLHREVWKFALLR